MKHFLKHLLLFTTSLVISTFIQAQTNTSTPKSVEEMVQKIVERYEEVPGVECVTLVKGGGLDLAKMMFNKQFGKDFMRGVSAITIINYGDASPEVCEALRKELDVFLNVLEEYNLSENKDFSDNNFVRCFAAKAGPQTLCDFVVALEKDDSKSILYMAGTIQVKK